MDNLGNRCAYNWSSAYPQLGNPGPGAQQAIYFPPPAILYGANMPGTISKAQAGALVAVNFAAGGGSTDQAIIGWWKNSDNYVVFRTSGDDGGRHLRYVRRVNGTTVASDTTTFQYQEGIRQWVGFTTTETHKVKIFWIVGTTLSYEYFEHLPALPRWTDISSGQWKIGDFSGVGVSQLNGGIEAVASYSSLPATSSLTSDKVELESYMTGIY